MQQVEAATERVELERAVTGVVRRPALRIVVARPVGFYQRRGKRLLDIALGALLLGLAVPVMALVTLIVLTSSGWPAFYRSPRLGAAARPFSMIKFRTMARNADVKLAELLSDPDVRAEYAMSAKLRNDPRRTAVGGVLRKLSIDELPQLWHVVKGEMSLVGPRPYMVEEAGRLQGSDEILAVAPGLTGPWQVMGRNELTFKDRLGLDREYVNGITFGSDLRYLVATVRCILRADGC